MVTWTICLAVNIARFQHIPQPLSQQNRILVMFPNALGQRKTDLEGSYWNVPLQFRCRIEWFSQWVI